MPEKVCFEPIGVIHSPFLQREGMPIQPAGAAGVRGTVEIFPQYAEGLADLDGFSHIILLYQFHQVTGASLKVRPFLDTQPRGLFATRAPKRPNPIGLSIVRLVEVEGNIVRIENVDVLDGTPLLDIKPYIPDFDQPEVTRTGWYGTAKRDVTTTRADDRFTD
ncbi:MAG: tRNA (N6-threonylcarbamoyladenosine(37)-N6)-methyltransferase TrmO [Anaerolineales bacterium]|jgi:tRNA-Thr(GGU) m(6)t(6)A37 methyltransferase TsaA